MGATTSFQKLTRLIQQYESDGGCVKRVEAEATEMQTEAGMNVTLDVPVSLCSVDESETTTAPTAATITEDGGLQVEFSSSVLPTLDDYISGDTTVNTEAVRIADDGTVVTTFAVVFGTEMEAGHADAGSTDSDSQARTVDRTDQENRTTDSASYESTPTSETSDNVAAKSNEVDHHDHDLIAAGTEDSENDQTEIERKLKAARNENLQPYDDTEYLQCLYDSFDTFTEMTENIEMDVASETVRRYMTEAGVHKPSSYNIIDETDEDDEEATNVASTDSHGGSDKTDAQTAAKGVNDDNGTAGESTAGEESDVEPEDPIESVFNKPLVADGIGLPDDIEIEELVDAIESSMTVHQMQRQLGLSRERTQNVLSELNLLDLVVRRIAHDPDREVSRVEIADRIRSSASSAC
ncbi:hypothetical protein [Halocatena salina]|uniref:Uncharacterized protein n=1 Tax=Halocatena salina TaxID=2934340 RepID=A0A8U0AAT7_9EURY|nr:hypothetical protein [Halocatena salina]UPM44907.1 hypothetical protein MW046_16120 [Halocatena salina]